MIIFCGKIYSQTDCFSYDIFHIIQCEIDEWNDETSLFDTSFVFVSREQDSAGNIDAVIEEFGKNSWEIDTSDVYYLENGKKILLNRPEPTGFSSHSGINENIVRSKKLHFNKCDLSYYYLWEDDMNPRGVKKSKQGLCYSAENEYFYYFDENNNLCKRDFKLSHTKAPVQYLIAGKYIVTVSSKEDCYKIVFEEGGSRLEWNISAEEVLLNKIDSTSFSFIASTFWPNKIELTFKINKKNRLQYYSRETICTYNSALKKWEYNTIINCNPDTLPWIVNDIDGDMNLMSAGYIKCRSCVQESKR